MKSSPLPARMPRWILPSMLPAFALSACTTVAPPILAAPQCFTEMVKSAELDKDVEHAPLPDGTAGGWVAYGNQEGGQLDKANSAKRAVVGIGETCERWQQDAKKQIEKKPWWRRVFG